MMENLAQCPTTIRDLRASCRHLALTQSGLMQWGLTDLTCCSQMSKDTTNGNNLSKAQRRQFEIESVDLCVEEDEQSNKKR